MTAAQWRNSYLQRHHKHQYFLREVFCLWRSGCALEPGVECCKQVRTIFNISGWEAQTLLQQLLWIWHGQRGDYSQECLLQFQVEWFVTRWHGRDIVFAYYKNRKPIFHKLPSNLKNMRRRRRKHIIFNLINPSNCHFWSLHTPSGIRSKVQTYWPPRLQKSPI